MSQLNTFLEGSDRVYAQFVNKALVDLQKASKSEQKEMIKAIIGRKGTFKYLEDADAKKLLNSVDKPTVGTVSPLRGNESFDELLDLNKAKNPFFDKNEYASLSWSHLPSRVSSNSLSRLKKLSPTFQYLNY